MKQVTIYLIHFLRPYKHAQHYLGATDKPLVSRLRKHEDGTGSKLMRAVAIHRIPWRLARLWSGTWADESRLHKQKNSSARLCPQCRVERSKRYGTDE